jgi:hypothetical protein
MRQGIWIPKEVDDLKINHSLKRLYAEIVSLHSIGSCFASNQYFADLMGLKPDTISGMIKKLKSLGLIEQTKFDGRKRFLAPVKNPSLGSVGGSVPSSAPVLQSVAASDSNRVSISTVQLLNKVHKTFEDFKMWARRNLSHASARQIELFGNPDELPDRYRIVWARFAM